jgi:AcrR family transcriptional regulator
VDRAPTAAPGRPERADAARNRARVLRAAERLFAERGAAKVSMEDVARAAGVGKGTLYRRFPDRAALADALLDEHERRLQRLVLTGPPPLGPGAPPARRLAAFYAAVIELLERHLDLVLVAETGAARYRTGTYAFWRRHVYVLLTDAGVPDTDGVLADLLLAPLTGELFAHLQLRGLARPAVTTALAGFAARVLR